MANSDKNVVITPNTSSSTADPQIAFSGADASTGPQTITLKAYPTNSGTLSFEGSAGQLFSVTNSFSGTIFSVNDASGIPSIEVIDSGLVKLAQYGGNILIGGSTSVSDQGQARLQVYHTSYTAEPYAGVLIKNTSSTGTQHTGLAIDAVQQAHVRFLLNGNLRWQIRVGNGNGTDDFRIYSWTANADAISINNSGTVNFSTAPTQGGGSSFGINVTGSAGTVTARNFTIGSTTRSVNHSADVSWSLADIGAAASSHTHSYAGSSSAGGQANTALVLSASDGTGYNTGMVALAARSAVSNPNQYSYGMFLEFKNASVVSGLGNYAGLLTVAPYGGGTGSGDPNYQLGFSPQAADSTVPPTLRIRAGVATTWGSWSILTTAARTFAQNLILG